MQNGDTLPRTALVTGGSRGIGRAICLRLAQEGLAICVNYAGNADAAEETAHLCAEKGVEAFALQGDVSTAAGCTALVEAALARLGRLDVLVNNAGITRDGLILRQSESDFDAVLDTNLKGAFFCAKAAARAMLRQRYGRIINISSIVGLRGNAGQASYAASKAGLLGLTKSLAKELASRPITVNAVAPGFIATAMTDAISPAARTATLAAIPAGRPGQPGEVADAVAFFARPESAYITGQVLCVDGGMAI
ncbi:MAG: 3-oxoacyl-[acyl-carrier-protein] reductase [Gemmiger sp.]|nr:3-oxoacyl-[acyl-carrier-protein] reductase [Gemmiger sp.]